MTDYTQPLIRLANATFSALDLIQDDAAAESLYQMLEGLPLEIRLAMDSPVRTAEEWHDILGEVLDEDVLGDIYHVEP